VHAAHEEKQKLEMVLRDLHGAEQEARQRLRALSGAILSHLDDTEQLVAESTGTFRAIVQAHPEASELRSSSLETMAEHVERAAIIAEATAAEADANRAERVALDAELAAVASARLAEAMRMQREAELVDATVRGPDTADGHGTATLGTSAAASETADAFFDTPPSFDPTAVAPRDRERPVSFADVE
jgi:hypothetical protein